MKQAVPALRILNDLEYEIELDKPGFPFSVCAGAPLFFRRLAEGGGIFQKTHSRIIRREADRFS